VNSRRVILRHLEEKSNGAVVTWSGDGSWFTAELPYDHRIEIDEPVPTGGNHGPRPTDLLLAAAASCSGISAQSLLKKMRQPVSALTVSASGERAEEWPRKFTDIVLDFGITVGEGWSRELIEKAIDRAVRKYCPVSATIESGEGGTAIEYRITIHDPSQD
jgi:putative redox protein